MNLWLDEELHPTAFLRPLFRTYVPKTVGSALCKLRHTYLVERLRFCPLKGSIYVAVDVKVLILPELATCGDTRLEQPPNRPRELQFTYLLPVIHVSLLL